MPAVDLDLMRRFGELLGKRRDEAALEGLPEASELVAEIEKVVAKMNALSSRTKGVFETVAMLLAQKNELRSLADEKQQQSYIEKERSHKTPVDKKQESIQDQQRLKQRIRKRDLEMDL